MPRTSFAAKARAKFPVLRPVGSALASAPELTAFAFVAAALAHAAFISRAGGICHGAFPGEVEAGSPSGNATK
jgi:hypothetical protein